MKSNKNTKAQNGQGRSFGRTVKEYRERRGWTQEELAWQAEIAREHVGRIERDKCVPSVATIGRLEKALNLQPMTLLKLKINPDCEEFQLSEEEKSVNFVCHELEIALISNLTKLDMMKACDVISTISDLLNHQE